MNNTTNIEAETPWRWSALLADLLWLEYEDAANDARSALAAGDKFRALALAITAHKIKSRYDQEISKLVFG